MAGIAEDKRVLTASPPNLAGPLSLFGLRKRIYATSQTLTADDIGCTIFTSGATTAVTYTLPSILGGADVAPFFVFCCAHVEGMVIQGPSNATIASNLTTASTVTVTTANASIGAIVLVLSDGTSWFANGFSKSATNAGLLIA